MRIGIASSGLGHVARGIEAWAKSLAERLHEEGEDVLLFCGGGAARCPHVRLRYLKRGSLAVRVITAAAPRIAWRRHLTAGYPLEQSSFARALGRRLRRGDGRDAVDVLHTQDFVAAGILARTVDFPVIFGNVSDEPPASLGAFTYLQHVSPPDYEAARAEPALARARHYLAPSFVDIRRFAPAAAGQRKRWRAEQGIPERAWVIGAAAALQRPHKRLDRLVDEVGSLLARAGGGERPHLLLAGAATADTPALERRARERLGANMTILKNVAFDAMPAVYGCMDVLVHPAAEEVFGLCLVEAMACGVPVVAHASPRLRFVVGDGGWLTDVTREGFLTTLWPGIRAEQAALSARARAHAETHFSWKALYPRYRKMYHDVVSEAGAQKNAAREVQRG
ncbi:MAG: glycosyltransferase family 4 protein [Lentisphaerae bacterium]|nr:glycosyltransferase family 4 protein [Lentisphaerota bacterium]